MAADHYISVEELMGALPPGDGQVGLDLEADSLYRYAERICLVQVCYGEEVELIDPLAGESLDPLVDWLTSSKIWMHGADYDMTLMLREWNMVPPMLYDTQIAAQLLGHQRFGYASLVEQYFGVELSKSSQKADWGKRPLSPKMLEYACNDVRYLLPLAHEVETKLKELGRYEWFLESCEAAQVRVRGREGEEKESWRISGSGRLQPTGLRFLRALWNWRDGEAASWNRPSFMVASNKQLIAWATDLAEGRKPNLPPKLRPDRLQRLESAIKDSHGIPEAEWPVKPKRVRQRFDETFEERLKEVMGGRNKIAEELDIDPSVIASRGVLEQIVSGRVESSEILLKWQLSLLEL
jgi:ribonuclease D